MSPGLAPPEPAPSLRSLESEFEAARAGLSPYVRETQWKRHVGIFSALLAGAGSQHWSAIREDERAAGPPERVVVGGMSPEGGDMAKVTLCVVQSWGLKGLGMEPWALE